MLTSIAVGKQLANVPMAVIFTQDLLAFGPIAQ